MIKKLSRQVRKDYENIQVRFCGLTRQEAKDEVKTLFRLSRQRRKRSAFKRVKFTCLGIAVIFDSRNLGLKFKCGHRPLAAGVFQLIKPALAPEVKEKLVNGFVDVALNDPGDTSSEFNRFLKP